MSRKRKKHIKKAAGERFTSEIRDMDLRQVLIVPIDISKKLPRALVANYFGDILVEPFSFGNNLEGAKMLEERIQEAKLQASASKIFVAMEATGHYGENLSAHLRGRGYALLAVNPYAVKLKRDGSLTWCKTDDIDLGAIGSLVLDNVVSEGARVRGVYYNLRLAVRARRRAVRTMAHIKTETRCIMDRLFPGLGEERCFKNIGTRSAREFLKCNPTPRRVLAMGERGLEKIGQYKKIRFSKEDLAGILRAASNALCKPKDEQEILIDLLQEKLAGLDVMEERVTFWEQKIGQFFVRTPGVWLLRISYVGVSMAAEFVGETADPFHFPAGGSYVRFAGMESRSKESGQFHSSTRPITKLGSARLRYAVGIIAQNVMWKNRYFKNFALRLIEKGKHLGVVRVAVACKFMKVAHPAMTLKERFAPPQSFADCFADDIEKKIRVFFEDHRARDIYESLLPVLRKELKSKGRYEPGEAAPEDDHAA